MDARFPLPEILRRALSGAVEDVPVRPAAVAAALEERDDD
jgi:hypothetical protein